MPVDVHDKNIFLYFSIILITQRQETCNHLVSLDQLDMFAQKYEDISLITNATVLNAMFVDY